MAMPCIYTFFSEEGVAIDYPRLSNIFKWGKELSTRQFQNPSKPI
jgi:hypothetical protein